MVNRDVAGRSLEDPESTGACRDDTWQLDQSPSNPDRTVPTMWACRGIVQIEPAILAGTDAAFENLQAGLDRIAEVKKLYRALSSEAVILGFTPWGWRRFLGGWS